MIADEIRAVTKNYKSIRFNGELLALADRVEAVERDAARYRWLFHHDDGKTSRVNHVYRIWDGESDWTTAVDDAIKEQADADKPKTYFNPNEGFGPF